jgi:hypothetical protein
MMRKPRQQEPIYALAARCLGGLPELLRGRTADPEGIASAPAEDPDAPFSRIIGFLPEPDEAGRGAPPLRDR